MARRYTGLTWRSSWRKSGGVGYETLRTGEEWRSCKASEAPHGVSKQSPHWYSACSELCGEEHLKMDKLHRHLLSGVIDLCLLLSHLNLLTASLPCDYTCRKATSFHLLCLDLVTAALDQSRSFRGSRGDRPVQSRQSPLQASYVPLSPGFRNS